MKNSPDNVTQSKRSQNKWAIASLVTLVGGWALIGFIGLVMATVIVGLHPVTGDQAGWNVLAFILLPIVAAKTYGVIAALAAFVLAVISLVKTKGRRNTLGIIMAVITGLMLFQIPDFLRIVFGIQ